MQLNDAIALIEHSSLSQPPQATWADLGCGEGLFTYALANLLSPGSTIYAIDKGPVGLTPHPNPHHVIIHKQQLDFVKDDIALTGLDGILMANSLHYVANKQRLIGKLIPHLKEDGVFLIVEYDTADANPWVPHPVTFDALTALFHAAGFIAVSRLAERASVFGTGNMYAALVRR